VRNLCIPAYAYACKRALSENKRTDPAICFNIACLKSFGALSIKQVNSDEQFSRGEIMANTVQSMRDASVKDWMNRHAPQQHAVFRSDDFGSQRAEPLDYKRSNAR
jgi:hypothetical protein